MYFLKDYEEHPYDDILDKYNETKDYKYLSYAFIKANKIRITELSQFLNQPWEKIALFVFNIQREIDNMPVANNFKDIERKIRNDWNDDDWDEDQIPDF